MVCVFIIHSNGNNDVSGAELHISDADRYGDWCS